MKKFFIVFTASCLAMSAFSCSSDSDDNNGYDNRAGAFFLSVSGESAEYLMQTDVLTEGQMLISENVRELEMSGYTWIFNSNPSVAVGLIYQQGDPGIGLGYGVNAEGVLQRLGQFRISSRFTSYGFFGNYALTSVGGQVLVDSAGNTVIDEKGNERADGVTFNFISLSDMNIEEKSMQTLNITGNGEQATLSGIVDMGDGTFLTGLVCSQAKDESETGGSSSGTVTYPDSVWVALIDADLKVKHIYRDNRISYSSGRYRSQYYSQIGRAGDGTIYVFSGSYDYNNTATTLPCGALRINTGASIFDSEYYFNIEAISQGYRFRKVWHITADYFLLEFYNHTGRLTAVTDPATQYAVVDMKGKTLRWIEGEFPSKEKITDTGMPMSYNGKIYFPLKEDGQYPAIYIIDPTTATAVKGLSVRGASSINAVGRLAQ